MQKNTLKRLKYLAKRIRNYNDKYDVAHDARAIFAFMYYKMTEDIAEFIHSPEMAFDDPEWITSLAEDLAERYMEAMDNIDDWLENGQQKEIYETVPRPWADAYLAIRDGRSYVVEDMVFLLMAHITHDIPLGLLKLKMEENGRSHISDYHRLNEIAARKVNDVQNIVAKRYNRFLIFLDKLSGNYDEFLTNYGIRIARSVAWYNACRLRDPLSEKEARKSIERSNTSFINSIRNPDSVLLRISLRVVRILIPPRRRWPKVR